MAETISYIFTSAIRFGLPFAFFYCGTCWAIGVIIKLFKNISLDV